MLTTRPTLIATAITLILMHPDCHAEERAKTLDKIEVVARPDQDTDYRASQARSATKTATPLMETPVAVQVLPRAVLEDQKVSTIKEALENVSGVRAQPSLGGTSGYLIRGFRTGNIYRNGLLTTSGSSLGDFDAANLERIEVVKGPAQLYGRTEPGGVINLSTKRALETPYAMLEQSLGSFDFYRSQWDAGGPLSQDSDWQYRFSGAYQDNESFRDFVRADRLLLNPSLSWKPAGGTEITLEFEYQKKHALADFGIPVIGARPANIPIGRNLGDPNTPIGDQDSRLFSSEIAHAINEDWTIQHRFLTARTDGANTFVNPAPAFDATAALNPQTGIMQRNIFRQQSHQRIYSSNLDLTGQIAAGRVEHNLLIGIDYYKSNNLYGSDGQWVAPNPALAINIFNPGPSYGISPTVFDTALLSSSTPTPRSDIYNQWYGLYVQDQITFDRLQVMLGGRYDWAETGRGRATLAGGFSAATQALFNSTPSLIRKDDGFSPRVSVLYKLDTDLNAYATWSKSFGANNAPAADGSTFDPQIGEQFELGLKAQLFDARLLGTLAAFSLTKDNILVPDLTTADLNDRVANRQRSQGLELDLTGRVTDTLSVLASYAWTDSEVLKDNAAGSPTQGKQLSNVPKHAGSVFVKYQFGERDGVNLGIGAYLAGKRQVDLANTAQLPGYARMDAFISYGGWQIGGQRLLAQLNVRNLLDKEYFESTDPDSNVAPRLGVYPGAPLSAIASLRIEF